MIHLYCGDGKGKTTAAAGLALRACGNGQRVVFAQFLKGRETGEIAALKRLPEIIVLRGDFDTRFTFQMTAQERLQTAELCSRLLSEAFQRAADEGAELLVLDEAVTACERGALPSELLRKQLQTYRQNFEIVITGSLPEEWMVRMADYVTDMEKIKHPYDLGVAARAGVEY